MRKNWVLDILQCLKLLRLKPCQSELSLISSISSDTEKNSHQLKSWQSFFLGDTKTKMYTVEPVPAWKASVCTSDKADNLTRKRRCCPVQCCRAKLFLAAYTELNTDRSPYDSVMALLLLNNFWKQKVQLSKIFFWFWSMRFMSL